MPRLKRRFREHRVKVTRCIRNPATGHSFKNSGKPLSLSVHFEFALGMNFGDVLRGTTAG